MKKITLHLLFSILFFTCSSPKKIGTSDIAGVYSYIDKSNNFYDELTLILKSDSTFIFKQRVGPEVFRVSGVYKNIDIKHFYIEVKDTITILRDEPIYNYYKIQDTFIARKNVIIINKKRLKKRRGIIAPVGARFNRIPY